MTGYAAFDAYLQGDQPLSLPVTLDGVDEVYTFRPPARKHMLRLKRIFADGTAHTMTAEQVTQEWELLAGPALWAKLDHLPERTHAKVCMTALLHFGVGEVAGLTHWVIGTPDAEGKAARLLGQVLTSRSQAPTGPTTPVGGSTTPPRGSAVGTTAPPLG